MLVYVGKTNTNTCIVRPLTLLPGPGTTTQRIKHGGAFPHLRNLSFCTRPLLFNDENNVLEMPL